MLVHWHVLCPDDKLRINYYCNPIVAKMAVEELRLFSWEYQNSFYTLLLTRIVRDYDNSSPSDGSVLDSACIFLNW